MIKNYIYINYLLHNFCFWFFDTVPLTAMMHNWNISEIGTYNTDIHFYYNKLKSMNEIQNIKLIEKKISLNG